MVRKLIEYEKCDEKGQKKIIKNLFKLDELQNKKEHDMIFGFKEEVIEFLPTYKFKCKNLIDRN
jgi:hypothetical protein